MLPTVLWLALFLFAIGFSYTLFEGLIKIFFSKNALIWLLISIVLIIFAIFRMWQNG